MAVISSSTIVDRVSEALQLNAAGPQPTTASGAADKDSRRLGLLGHSAPQPPSINTHRGIMDRAFHLARVWIWRAEGIDANDPYDKGGRTRFGISAAAHPDIEISSLTAEKASQIYEREYWRARGCDLLPTPLAIAVFDGEVNHSMGTATKFLQDALRVTVDGIIGNQTATAAHDAPLYQTLERYMANRGVYYHEIVANDTTQLRFLEGWLWRLFRLQRYILAEVDYGLSA